MVRHTEGAGHLTGTYALPSGRLEQGETLEEGALRELFEETGLRAEKSDLIKIKEPFYAKIPRKGGEIADMKWDVFVARKFTGELRSSEETIPEWVELEKVPELTLIANTENAIREGLKLFKNV